jgi:branched-chain amino acid transport system substrate-binding protein
MKKSSIGISIFATLILMFAPFLSSHAKKEATAPETKILRVGAIFALTGPAAPGIKDNMQGAQAAADLINEKGGIVVDGHQYLLEIIPEDNKSAPDGTIAAANKLVYKDGVKFIVGPVVPLLSIAMTPITEKAKVLRCKVNGTGTQAEMNLDLHYTFSTFIEVQYIKSGYDYFVENYPGVKKIAITGPDEPGGQTFLKLSKKEAERHGLEVVYAEPYPFGTQDFYPILTKALAQKPDAVELGVGVAPWYAGLIKQARELRFNGPMFAPSTTGDIYFVQKMVGKDFAHDIFFLDPDLKSSEMPFLIKEIGRRVRNKYGAELTSSHCLGWEALQCLVEAIKAAQSLNPTLVAQTWENMKNINTLYGKGTMGGLKDFGINHVIMKPRPVTKLENGNVKFIKLINP